MGRDLVPVRPILVPAKKPKVPSFVTEQFEEITRTVTTTPGKVTTHSLRRTVTRKRLARDDE